MCILYIIYVNAHLEYSISAVLWEYSGAPAPYYTDLQSNVPSLELYLSIGRCEMHFALAV
jgi:hypothetical protein